MNEGHSALLAIERIRALTEQGTSTDAAIEQVRRSTVFTTHTPVPAGNEQFDEEPRRPLRRRASPRRRASASTELLALGRFGDHPGFGLTPLALRLSGHANGVSALHGEVAREMWAGLWPGDGRRRSATSRTASTSRTWLDPSLAALLRDAGVDPRRRPTRRTGMPSRGLDPDALERVHAAAKTRLAERTGLDPERLTIGFARRFATYKRARASSSATSSGCSRCRCRSSSPARRIRRTPTART